MKRSTLFIAVIALIVLSLLNTPAFAGRVGGPLYNVSTVPGGVSVYYDVYFADGEPAVVTVVGNGNSMLSVLIYDADGHVAMGTGFLDRREAVMDVYRGGMFRVEVRNVGISDNTFTLTTN